MNAQRVDGMFCAQIQLERVTELFLVDGRWQMGLDRSNIDMVGERAQGKITRDYVSSECRDKGYFQIAGEVLKAAGRTSYTCLNGFQVRQTFDMSPRIHLLLPQSICPHRSCQNKHLMLFGFRVYAESDRRWVIVYTVCQHTQTTLVVDDNGNLPLLPDFRNLLSKKKSRLLLLAMTSLLPRQYPLLLLQDVERTAKQSQDYQLVLVAMLNLPLYLPNLQEEMQLRSYSDYASQISPERFKDGQEKEGEWRRLQDEGISIDNGTIAPLLYSFLLQFYDAGSIMVCNCTYCILICKWYAFPCWAPFGVQYVLCYKLHFKSSCSYRTICISSS